VLIKLRTEWYGSLYVFNAFWSARWCMGELLQYILWWATGSDRKTQRWTPVPSGSYVTESFDARGESSQWPPLTAIMMFKQFTIIIEFQFIWFKHLKCVKLRTFFFYFFHRFCRPLNSAAIGGRASHPPPTSTQQHPCQLVTWVHCNIRRDELPSEILHLSW
jgi:hypothetical protein